MTAQINAQNDSMNIFRVKSSIDKQRDRLSFQLGELISATITSQSNGKTQLTTRDNFSFEADSSKINGNLGDELQFEVVKTGDKELTLKQVIKGTSDSAQTFMKLKSAADLKELFKQNNMLSDEKIFKDNKTRNEEAEAERKTSQALAKIRRQITYATTDINVNVMSELISSGVSLNKINLHVLNNAMKEVNVKPQLKIKSELAKTLDSLSEDMGIALNETRKPSEKYADALGLNEDEVINVIKRTAKEDKALTLGNIYKSKHATSNSSARAENKKTEALSDKALEALEPEILRVLASNDLPRTEENIEISKSLISNDIALTKLNISKFYFLKNLNASSLEPILQSLDKDDGIEDINLFDVYEENSKAALYKSYEEIIKSLPHVSTANINFLIKHHKPITLNNLKNAAASSGASATRNIETPETAEVTTAKRRIAEIRLKLTHEAALRLAGKNIAIDASPLAEALETLKKQEQINYASNLRFMGVQADESNIGIMRGLYDKMPSFAYVSQNALSNIVGSITKQGNTFNVTNTYNAIESSRVSELYEHNSTPARISAPFIDLDKHLKDYLENIGLETSDKNLKAAKILFNNRLEINEDAISQVKLVEAKIDRIYNKMHPAIAAGMIKDGHNPLSMHVDEILEYVDKFNDIYGENLSDKISSFIMQMDNAHSYTDEERQGIIAIYKMLNTMLNHGGAGLGQIIKNKTPMTLGNMMESAKLYKSTVIKHRKFDYTVDDGSNGYMSADSPSSIRNAIERAVAQVKSQIADDEKERISSLLESNNMAETLENIYLAEANTGENLAKTAYEALNLKNITDNARPNYLRNLLNANPYATNLSTDDIAEFLKEQALTYSEADQAALQTKLAQAYAGQLEKLADTPPQIVKWMNDNNIETNAASILTMLEIVRDPFCLSKRLDKLSKTLDSINESAEDGDDDSAEDGEAMDINPDIFGTDLKGIGDSDDITKRLDAIDYKLRLMSADIQTAKLMEQVNSAREAIKLQNKIMSSRDGNEYHIPVKLHDKISGLNMYFLNNNNEAENILLSLDTNSLGRVKVYVQKSDDTLNLTVSAEHSASVSYLRENADALLNYVRESGFGAKKIEVEFSAASF